jgi:N-acetylneuraminate synthase
MKIANKKIGNSLDPYVIAEISANHNGSLERAIKIVELAAKNGADAIKLQTYKPETLTINSDRPEFFINDASSIWNKRRLWDLYKEAYTPWEWHVPIFTKAREMGLACISTAFDKSSVEFLLDINVDAIKISSFELIHIPLINLVAKTGKPILMSTGMATLKEIERAVKEVRLAKNNQFVLLKCTSSYPSDESDANILTMRDMMDRFKCQVGLSDHTLSSYAAFSAVALGGSVIEKHFTINRSDGGVDSEFSIEPKELKELVSGVRLVRSSLGKVDYSPKIVESASIKERPSIYVIKEILKGDIFTSNNVKIIRPSGGILPGYYNTILGKKSACRIQAETPLSWKMVV